MTPRFAGVTPSVSSGLAERAADTDADAPTPVSLYVHVPFCVSKCGYCDFYSETGESKRFGQFVDAAVFEAGHWSHYDLLDDVPTLYFGGGTPTMLGAELARLVRAIRETARLRADAEVTVETNPETTDAALIALLVEAGVNRFSVGVQSFDDDVLRTLGRCHDAARSDAALSALRRAGVAFSVDLICGVPGQSYESWDATLERTVESGARHVSVYPLTIEEGTPMAAAVQAGSIAAPDPDQAADMMLAAEVALAAAGIARYEVANYAQPGHEARHNVVYWTGGAYLGVGPRAASMLPYGLYERVADAEGWTASGSRPEAAARARFTRECTLQSYVRTPLAQPGPIETLSASEAAREDVMLGLRLVEGVPLEQVQAAGLTPVLEGLDAQGLVRLLPDGEGTMRWSTTQRGWLMGNAVFGAVWAGK